MKRMIMEVSLSLSLSLPLCSLCVWMFITGSGETGQEGEGKMEVIETDTANIKLGSELTTINIDGAHSITATTSSVSESLPVYDNREGDHGGQHTDDASITTTTTEVTYKPSDKVETTSQDEAMSGGSGMEGGTDGVVVSGVDGTSSGNGGWLEESEGYQKVPFAALYYHAATGYYYDAVCSHSLLSNLLSYPDFTV